MKNFSLSLFLVFFVNSTVLALAGPSEDTVQSYFANLKQATTMLDKHIAAHDRSGLIAYCAVGGQCEYLAQNPRIFDILVFEWQRAGPFQKLYANKEFPKDGQTFKLGGHFKELGHVHIDFVREAEGWRLKDIWNCR